MYGNYAEIRDFKGYNDSQVSKATGISKATFSDWKNGRSKPKYDKLKKIAGFLECSVTDIRPVEHGKPQFDYQVVVEDMSGMDKIAEIFVEAYKKTAEGAFEERILSYAKKLSALNDNDKQMVFDMIDRLSGK